MGQYGFSVLPFILICRLWQLNLEVRQIVKLLMLAAIDCFLSPACPGTGISGHSIELESTGIKPCMSVCSVWFLNISLPRWLPFWLSRRW
jgi:hypothetical protein